MIYNPLISIIIPTYNRGDLIGETINSIIKQSYQNWECIIVDDGSQDNTVEIIKGYTDDDPRIKFHNRPSDRSAGGNGARNFGFLQSKGDYIKWLDSDDLLADGILEKEIENLHQKSSDIILSSWQYFDSKNKEYDIRNKLVLANPKTGHELLNLMGKLGEFSFPSCYLVKRELVELAGLWNERLKINQDGEFFFRILLYTKSLTSLIFLGTLHRRDGENKVSQKTDNQSIQNRINSWKLIDYQINIKEPENLSDYIEGTKKIIYNELKRKNLINLIVNNKNFFKKNISSETSRRFKLKYFLHKFKL